MVQKEIGSDFWDNPRLPNPQKFQIQGLSYANQGRFFISGRSAIRAFIKEQQKHKNCKKVLLPAYTCSTVIVPFEKEGWEISYYGINKDFKPDKDDLLNKLESFNPNVIYIQSYFGFNTIQGLDNVISYCKRNNIVVIEDITHNLLSEFKKTEADYYVGSLRKFFAISEGGVLFSSKFSEEEITCGECKTEVISLALTAFNQKKEYMEGNSNIEKEEFRSSYSKYHDYISLYDEPYLMNEDTQKRLCEIDYKTIKNIRKDNFVILVNHLKKIKWLALPINKINTDEVPLFCPIYIENEQSRNKVQSYLIEKNIYCPVIWPRYMDADQINEQSSYIYDHILCIPCDQRYTEEDMYYIISTISEINDLQEDK